MAIAAEHPSSAAEMSESRKQLTALLVGCGVYKPDRALFSVTGRDRVRWLNGMVSNNIRDLAVGHGVYAFVLNPQGHIQGDLYAFNRGESLTIEIGRSQAETLMPLLRRYIIMDKVEVEELTGKTAAIGIAGPASKKTLSAVGVPVPELDTLQFVELNWNASPVIVVRRDNPHVDGYELWVSAETLDSAWLALLESGAVAVQPDTLETFRIVCGIPNFGQDIRERTLPQETGQERALNFTKGCYIGQEIVERIRARGSVHRTLVGFEIEGPVPSPGTKVQYDGKDVGEITSVTSAPLKGKQLGLGYLRKEAMAPDRVFAAGEASVKAASLPFTDIFE